MRIKVLGRFWRHQFRFGAAEHYANLGLGRITPRLVVAHTAQMETNQGTRSFQLYCECVRYRWFHPNRPTHRIVRAIATTRHHHHPQAQLWASCASSTPTRARLRPFPWYVRPIRCMTRAATGSQRRWLTFAAVSPAHAILPSTPTNTHFHSTPRPSVSGRSPIDTRTAHISARQGE